MRRPSIFVLAAIFLLGAVPALAHDVKEDSTVKLRREDGEWRGRVNSGRGFCERGRRIVLRKRGPDGSVKVGEATTDENGRYTIEGEKTPGPYYAIAKRKEKGSSDHSHICTRAFSNEVGKQTWS